MDGGTEVLGVGNYVFSMAMVCAESAGYNPSKRLLGDGVEEDGM
jgi:hypothetical protein